MSSPSPLLSHTTRTAAALFPRATETSNGLDNAAEIASIVGGIFAGLAVLVAVVFGIWQIRRWNKEDQRRDNRWYNKWPRKLLFWR